MRFNDLHAKRLRRVWYTVSVGAILLSVFARDPDAEAASDAEGTEGTAARAGERATRMDLGTRAAANRLYRGHPRAAWVRAAGPWGTWHGTLAWPVRSGHWVRGYGSGAADYHLAVDIAAKSGADVRAAAPGLVAYTGNAIDGYGNVAFLVHPGGLVTMYAHNSSLLVQPGQRVQAGEPIARVGDTGISRGPHVHFELLFRGENCDPTALFRPGIRPEPGAGYTWPDPAVAWSQLSERPDAVRCAERRDHPG